MRDEKEGRQKQARTPKAVTFPKKNELPRVGLEPTTLYTLDRAHMYNIYCTCRLYFDLCSGAEREEEEGEKQREKEGEEGAAGARGAEGGVREETGGQEGWGEEGEEERILRGLEVVSTLDEAAMFLEPVDLEEIPDYCTLVPFPTDLATIKTRLQNRFYR